MARLGRYNVYKDNPGQASAPGVSSDTNAGYEVGSRWYDTRYGAFWICVDATAGAAKWIFTGGMTMVGAIIGANMNVTTDQSFVMLRPNVTTSKLAINKILVTNASISLTTAAGGVYDAAAKGGNAIVAAAQAYAGLTGSSKLLSLTLAAAGTTNIFSVAPILSLTTAQGAAATADFYLFADVLPATV